ncbi:MAG TPA: ferritin-like domain-containing protein [Actinomycetota bacterium]|nr:ferritin-like domain-containing protein [Actinomycetota bacterium]
MSSHPLYTTPVTEDQWEIPGTFETVFNWEYDDQRDRLVSLYKKGKDKQWDAAERIDWSLEVDPENPSQMPDEANIGIYGSEIWERMTEAEKVELRRHVEAWRASQFLHGEQGALICSSKIVQAVPDIDSKFYAATQVIDEARHVEAYSRYVHTKVKLAYPINPNLRTLLEQVIRDSRWDFTYLGMQVLIEGLALAAFGLIRDAAQNPLAASINAYVMQDEARHVAFGRLALRDYYPQLTQAERDEREDFVVEACYLMRDRFKAEEIWENVGLPVRECAQYVDTSERMQMFRNILFMRIVPIVKDIGLWGEKVQKAYADMGVLDFASIDPDVAAAQDEDIAEQFDLRRRQIEDTIAAAE